MITTANLNQRRLRKAYERLSPEQRREALERYERHLRFCKMASIAPQPLYLFECVEELNAGRGLEAEDLKG